MFEVFRKKIFCNVAISFIILIGLVVFWGISLRSLFEPGISNIFGKTKEITAGTDLAQYKNTKVSCTIQNVLNYVVNYYGKDDPDKVVYTCGYVALDDNMENPFCVFVPADKRYLMDALLDETWSNMQEESSNNYRKPVQVEGYVREAGDKSRQCYIEALNEIYGEGYANNITTVYFIDDENVTIGETYASYQWIFLLFMGGMVAYVLVLILQGLHYRKGIKSFMAENGINAAVLENEFRLAEEVANCFWISPQYTFFVTTAQVKIINNKEIVWAYRKTHSGKTTTYSVVLCTVNQKRYDSGVQMRDGVEKVLQYYEKNFPFIVIGADREKRRLFKRNFAGFLQLQYIRNRNDGEYWS